MTTKMSLIGLGGLVLAAASTLAFAGSKSERADCPGRITCPLTGDAICRDQCPGVDANRADCPGRIQCPETGELVCVDRCPVSAGAKSAAVPSCSSGRK